MDDHELLRRVLARSGSAGPRSAAEGRRADLLDDDARAWSELIRRYRALMYRCVMKVIARSRVHCAADADEVYAEVLLQLVRDDKRKLRMYDPARGAKLGSWIGMIAIHAAYDYLRSAARRPVLSEDGNVDGIANTFDRHVASPLDRVIANERAAKLDSLAAELTDRDRAFVELYFKRDLDPDQVATAMKISLKTVYSKKHKIREQLVRLAA